MHAADRLTERIRATSPVCVGLDPVLEKFPKGIARNADGVKTFCCGICDAVADIASCVKPNIAFFEVLGWEGMQAFWDVCAYASEKGLVVIADAKRGDIGSTAEAYADAYLHKGSPIDALTVNPFAGSDSVTPFIDRCAKYDKGVFVWVKSSNASSGELQDLPVGDEVVHEHLAQLVESWGAEHLGKKSHLSLVGAIVGATYPEELTYLRTLMPHIPFLIPGYGTQGGKASDVVAGFIPDGTGAIINASRSLIYASGGEDWQAAAAAAAEGMVADIHAALSARKDIGHRTSDRGTPRSAKS